ncbi:oligopeptidase B [Litorimonas taeanensis]|uniref:Oligopeptidase B n=1 Tax=Litorimonas taeanensis TaxID=568099 RepID=A0A420WIQ5_9PROT|nr:S9 family peptidase [Litorimonas taeanensis]RKQ70883.1 oligopeptidase B [Litorimonas taeanensis]
MASIFQTNTQPPFAEKKPLRTEQLSRVRHDDYAWMKDENWQAVMQDPSKLDNAIRAHLEAENAYTEAVLSPLDTLKETLFDEMKARIEPEAASTPLPDGGWAYFHYYRTGDQHGVYARVPKNQSEKALRLTEALLAESETVLDAEDLSQNYPAYFDLGAVSHSPDHKWVAYGVDGQGSENYQVSVRALNGTNEVIKTKIDSAAGALVWAANSRTLFWVERDENQRPHAVMRQDIFDDKSQAVCVYKEDNPGFFVSVGTSDDMRYIEISAHNHTTSETWRIDAAAPEKPAICFAKRTPNLEYSLQDQGGRSYVLTNAHGAVDFQIMVADGPSSASEWKPFIPHKPGTLIIGVESFRHFLVRLERENALPRLVIRDMRDGEEHVIEMTEPAYSLGLVSGYEYDTTQLYFSYASPTTPAQIFAYDMETRERVLVKTQEVPSGHDVTHYKTERLSITARDGADVPVTVLRRENTPIDGSAPVLLYGYGSYGITIPAAFRTTILSLIDRGFIFAIAHIRGGMAKGYQWYLDGKLEKKTNTFNDFIDTGRALCDLGYTRKGHIVCHGGSAGGLLVGAAINQAPDLFAGAIAAVPFVDVLNTMSDTSLPLTPPEWPEWGNPLEDEAAYDQILSYSPYDQVIEQAYPATLITAGLTDPRVTYWEPAKWAAKLRDNQTGNAPILLKTNMEAGHQGESGRYDSLKETALEYAFALSAVGLASI